MAKVAETRALIGGRLASSVLPTLSRYAIRHSTI